LEERLVFLVLAQHEAVARLPDGVLNHIADADVALPLADEAEADRLLLRVVRERQGLQRLAHLVVHDRVQEADALQFRQPHAPHAVGAPHVQLLDVHHVLAGRLLLLLGGDQVAPLPVELLFLLGQPRQLLRTNMPYMSEESKALTHVPAGHPEGYLEAFANIYKLAIADIRRVESGEQPVGGYPTVYDGLRGMQFITKVVESSQKGAVWVDF